MRNKRTKQILLWVSVALAALLAVYGVLRFAFSIDVLDQSGWNTKNHYFYELINNGGTEFYIALTLSSRNIPEDLRKSSDEINVHYPSSQQKANWQWRTPFRTKVSKIDQDTGEEKLYELLNKKLDEIKAFEITLCSKLKNEI